MGLAVPQLPRQWDLPCVRREYDKAESMYKRSIAMDRRALSLTTFR